MIYKNNNNKKIYTNDRKQKKKLTHDFSFLYNYWVLNLLCHPVQHDTNLNHLPYLKSKKTEMENLLLFFLK